MSMNFDQLNNPVVGSDPTDAGQRRAEQVGFVCVLALTSLFVIAELAAPGPLVLAAALAFSLSAAVWVVSLYVQWRTGVLYLPSARRLWLVVGTGVAVGGVGFALTRWTSLGRLGSIVLLAGLLIGYLGAGLGIIRWRFTVWSARTSAAGDGNARVRAVGLVSALVVLLGIAAIGANDLGGASDLRAGLLLGLGIAPQPAILSVLAEQARGWSWLVDRLKAVRFRAVLVVVALAVIALAVVKAPGNAEVEVPARWALVILAALVVAIVSATLADIAAVLLVLALMGVAAPTAAPLEDPWPTDEHVLVALGDSYLSGEGARQFLEGTDDAGYNECRRAPTAWPVLVSERDPFDGLVFLACSGARTYNLRHEPGAGMPQAWAPRPESQYPESQGTQLDDYSGRYGSLVKDPALVVLSLGGNDAGFATIGLTCLAPGSCNSTEPKGLFSKGNLKRVANRLRQAYAEVRNAFPTSPVVVVPYPDPLYDEPAEIPCGSAFLKDGDVTFVKELLADLNQVISSVADDYGFYVAEPMANALADRHLQLCDPANHGSAGINFVNARSVGGVSGNRFNPITWKHGSLHPNERGHAALARAFETWLADLGGGDPAAGLASLQNPFEHRRLPDTAPRREKYDEDLSDDCADVDGPEACNDQATSWALNEVGQTLLGSSPWILLVVLGAWVLGITLVPRPSEDVDRPRP